MKKFDGMIYYDSLEVILKETEEKSQKDQVVTASKPSKPLLT